MLPVPWCCPRKWCSKIWPRNAGKYYRSAHKENINSKTIMVHSMPTEYDPPGERDVPQEEDTGVLQKQIRSLHDIDNFQTSPTYNAFLGFILDLNEAVTGKPLSFDCHVSNLVGGIVSMLTTMKSWTTEIPAKPTRSRFGNESFCLWFDRLKEKAPELIKSFFPPTALPSTCEFTYEEVLQELVAYLTNSVGNRTRIDYGSGHEAHFVAFLYCLQCVGVLTPEDRPALVLRVFYTYLTLMRHLQEVYWLEPAGSHGVWGLDDYQFLPFLWGAAQLKGHKYIKPRSIRSDDVVDTYSHEYMYLGCIQFIKKVKTGSLMEHSPMLVDISGVKTWDKVNEGMIKMYKAELLHKYPVMQHFLFGKLLPFQAGTAKDDACEEDHDHAHAHTMPNCCVSRIPSAFSTTLSGEKRPRSVFSALD
eukprot:Phypoly_transcript_08766.p1 GENE.Phypoly_transcript_08766~~Phypoly_transcript_08766.p1  ORF type:complete len:417 (+),score=69.92 Phypoly_transcript_08766:107-1357(+)